MKLSIIIVNFNTKDLLRDCIQSIIRSIPLNHPLSSNYEVIVIDNASTDNSVSMVKKEFPQVKLIKNKRNLGFSKANNQGIKKTRGEYILLLNSDTEIINNALKEIIDFAESKKDLGIAGPKLLNPDGRPQPSTAPFYTLPVTFLSLFGGDKFLRCSPSKTAKVAWVSGACFLIKKSVTDKIGLLDENFFMYVEEMEYCYRAKKAGFQVYFYPQAEVIHHVRGSSKAGKQKAIWGIYQGLIYFYQKHFAPWQLNVLKFLLRLKAALAWLVGIFINNPYLKKTYAKAFKLV